MLGVWSTAWNTGLPAGLFSFIKTVPIPLTPCSLLYSTFAPSMARRFKLMWQRRLNVHTTLLITMSITGLSSAASLFAVSPSFCSGKSLFTFSLFSSCSAMDSVPAARSVPVSTKLCESGSIGSVLIGSCFISVRGWMELEAAIGVKDSNRGVEISRRALSKATNTARSGGESYVYVILLVSNTSETFKPT